MKHGTCPHCGTPLESPFQTYCSNACGASHNLADTPSRFTALPWVYAERQKGKYPAHTERGGKWLVFVDKTRLDEVWAKIKMATEEGKLGGSAKAATAGLNSRSHNPNDKVICVYTYDYTDTADKFHIKEELRKLGITWRLPYKADEATRAGQYSRPNADAL